MLLINPLQKAPVKLRLQRDLTRAIKRGHPWVFADALRQRPSAPAGTHAILLDNKKGREIAAGFYDARSPLAFRVCSSDSDTPLNNSWANTQMTRALNLRKTLFNTQTTGFRLFNGEGDGLPGLICDTYGDTAVMQLDGPGPAAFWNAEGIAHWVSEKLSLKCVYLKEQSRRKEGSRALIGSLSNTPVSFLENGVQFTANLISGQKTGFFLDQRDNRQQIKTFAAGKNVLNLFGYTGGFSIYAALGGASHVTTVDLAAPALQAADHHWQLNGLPATNHTTAKADAFTFLETAKKQKKKWELVIVDPPSFAPSKEAVAKATTAYKNLISAAAEVTALDGFLAAASCSSHIDTPAFLDICESAISQAHRRATLLTISGQPADHPTPLPFSEFRYLKFVLMRVE